jgi:uncharacterized protein YukE
MGDAPLPTSVDIRQLDDAARWLKQLQGFVERDCLGHLPEIARQVSTADLDMSGVDAKLTGRASVFGAFYSGYGLQAKHDATYQVVRASLQRLAEHLGKVADATEKIAANYRTVEERNRANAQDILRALESGRYTAIHPDAVAGGRTQSEQLPDQPGGEPTVLAPGPLDGSRRPGGGGGTTSV